MAQAALEGTSQPSFMNSAPFKADFVSSLVEAQLTADINKILQQNVLNPDPTPDANKIVKALQEFNKTNKFPSEVFGRENETKNFKVGIIGGGMAGLYSALILQHLGIDYEILEANPKRLGGRVYTHYFPTPPGEKKNPHDYYDIGAMRFPHSPIMARTFDLFKRLDMGTPGKPRDEKIVLIPYYLTGRNCPTRYNDITADISKNEPERIVHSDGTETTLLADKGKNEIHKKDPGDDPFKVSTANGGTVPATRVSGNARDEILNDAFDRFTEKIKKATEMTVKAEAADDPKLKLDAADARQHAYEYLMRHDKYSLRDYLQNVEGYDSETVHWIETNDSASGWFDEAFTEQVFESMAFAFAKDTKWWCVEGGTGVTVDRFKEKIDMSKVFQGKVVKKMELVEDHGIPTSVALTMYDYPPDPRQPQEPLVEETRTYSAVINTTTLGALQKIDLTGMELPYGMKTAIRVLRYDTSTKVGIKFREMWWKRPEFKNITLGGVAKTDLPIRVCVYPSYNIHDEGEGVLLASYTWGQDSERMAAHVSTNSPDQDKGLKELMVYNLARLHTMTEPKEDYEQRFQNNKQTIHDAWITHHAWDWSKDEFSAGAFALFSAGQFTTLIPHLVRPASDGRFVVVGEHASANHAWIVGALDSALRGLKQILTRFNMDDKLKDMLDEFGDVDELKQEQVAKQVIISMLTEEQMAKLKLGKPVQAVAQVQQV